VILHYFLFDFAIQALRDECVWKRCKVFPTADWGADGIFLFEGCMDVEII
jgi:hypothetical protein